MLAYNDMASYLVSCRPEEGLEHCERQIVICPAFK